MEEKIKVPGYKRRDGQEARRELLNKLGDRIELPRDTSTMDMNDDALDAAICVLAGADFLGREVMDLVNIVVAKREGWIWVRKLIFSKSVLSIIYQGRDSAARDLVINQLGGWSTSNKEFVK